MLIAFLLAISIFPQKTHASEKISDASAKLQITTLIRSQSSDMRVVAIEKVFERHNSNLAQYAPLFVKYADEYGIDWRLLPAIAAHESYYGSMYVYGTHNVYGWGGGYIYFPTWDDGIRTISQALHDNYYNRGATTVWTIGPIYAGDPAWSNHVNNYMQEFNNEYFQLSDISLIPTL